jgi:hypothetical protein
MLPRNINRVNVNLALEFQKKDGNLSQEKPLHSAHNGTYVHWYNRVISSIVGDRGDSSSNVFFAIPHRNPHL